MNTFLQFIQSHGMQILDKSWEHLYISFLAILLGIVIAIPLGILLTRLPKIANYVIGTVSVLQTFPSLAILAFFIPFLGIGKLPAILALFIYSMLPILRNTYTGIKNVDKSLLETGKGMGMTGWEAITRVEMPLAVPVIMAGIRMSAVYLIGWATLASFVGGGGLGDLIFDGLNLFQPSLIIAGAIPSTILALLLDFGLGRFENWMTPTGVQLAKKAE